MRKRTKIILFASLAISAAIALVAQTCVTPSGQPGQTFFVYNVKDYGATGNGSTDDTVAIQNAINSLPSQGGELVFPGPKYKTTSTITVSHDQVTLTGTGRGGTVIDYEPTSAGAAIVFSKPTPSTNDIARCAMRGFEIVSANTSVKKTAIKLVAVTDFNLENIFIFGTGGSNIFTGGSPSIGIETLGHEVSSVSKVTVQADEPISIETNPNPHGGIQLDMDQWHWSDLYLIANGFPDIAVAANTLLTNVKFDGMEEWVSGTYGFYWPATTVGASYLVQFENVRTEQGSSSSAFSFYITHSGGQTQGLRINGFDGDPNRSGIYLRNTYWTHVGSYIYGGGHTVLDADSSNSHLKVTDSYFGSAPLGSGTTITVGGDGYVDVP